MECDGYGFSFVISFETRSGPGLRGRDGYSASWRPIHQSRCAIKVGGSPFKTHVEAEIACTAMLAHLDSRRLIKSSIAIQRIISRVRG